MTDTPSSPVTAAEPVTVTVYAWGDNENTPAEAVHHALEYARKAGFVESWSEPTAPAQRVTGASDIVDEAACLIWAELCPGMIMGDEDRQHYENAAKDVLALPRTAQSSPDAIEIERLIFKHVRVRELFDGAETFVGTSAAADAILALFRAPAQSSPDAVQMYREACEAKDKRINELEERIAELQYQAGMYKSLYENCHKEASALSSTDRAPATLGGQIAAIYGELDAEDCAWIDREWIKWRGAGTITYALSSNETHESNKP